MRILAGFLLAGAMWAQPAFQNLAPTAEGSVVYFSSPLRLKGTDEYPSQPKIFFWDEKNGVQLYEQKPPTVINVGEGFASTTAYNLVAPSIGSDGRTIAITGLSDCTWGTPCTVSVNLYQAEIRVAGRAPLVINGVPSVSPNGSFVALGSPVVAPFGPVESTILDLSTGQQQHPIGLAANFPRRHGVANDGTVILYEQSPEAPVELQPWSGAAVQLSVPPVDTLLIDASAAHVFYETPDNAAPFTLFDLMVLDLTTGVATETATVQAPSGEPAPFDISDDGSLAAFIQLGQAWIVHSDGTKLMQITNVQDPIVEIALSGSGSRLFAITSASRMLRVDLSTLAEEEIIPATPIASGLSVNISPGFFLSPGSLCEVDLGTQPIQSISLFGHDLPILNETQGQIEVEVPYDLPAGNGFADAPLKQQSDGPFESAMLGSPFEVAFSPAWFLLDNYVAALHQNFSGPITAGNPAHPGEIIHAYGTGFGPVTPEPPLGQPASANPLSRITAPFACGLESESSALVPADIWFDGLAPGWIGLYQFDILLPARPAGTYTYLICGNAPNPLAGNNAEGLLPMADK